MGLQSSSFSRSGLSPPILETARLELRPFVPGDVEAVHAYRRDPEVMRFAGGPDRSLEDTRRTLETYCRHQRLYGFSKWAVLMKGTGELLGDSGLLPMNDVPEFELGYRLAKRFWSRASPRNVDRHGSMRRSARWS